MSACMPLDFVQVSSSSSSSSGTFLVKTPPRVLLLLRQFSHYSIALLVEQCSLPSDLSSRNSIKEILVAHEGLACGLDAISALHNYACSIGVDSISSSSQGCLGQGLLQSVPSLQVSVAMLYQGIVMVSIGSLSTRSPSVMFLLFR